MKANVLECPKYCQYEGGQCTRIKAKLELQDAFFAYASHPKHMSEQISEAIKLIDEQNICSIQDWQDLSIGGKIIYCEICKAIRRSAVLVADVTTFNDNVLFEIGFAIGLGKRIWLLRDPSYEDSKAMFKRIGLLDYTGYTPFRNSSDIMTAFLSAKPWEDNIEKNNAYFAPSMEKGAKLFYFKSIYNSDGSIELSSLIRKRKIPTDQVDPTENTQFSLRDFSKRISSSLGVVVHMCDPKRKGAEVHNAQCTFFAGMGLAMEKPILIVQEGEVDRPIDYGEIIRTYTNSKNIRFFFENWIKTVESNHEKSNHFSSSGEARNAESLDSISLGDVAAENEIVELESYFVKTPIFHKINQVKDCIVAGRKGTGKTALFFEIRRTYWQQQWKYIVLDLKPEGYQLKLFGEIILKNFPDGTKQYLIKSLWHYVVLTEIGRQILRDDKFAFQKEETAKIYQDIEKNVNPLGLHWEGDFAQRLLELVNFLNHKLKGTSSDDVHANLTEYMHLNELASLKKSISSYLKFKSGIVILVDNLDKDWKPFENLNIEIDILRALLDSLKTLSNDLSKNGIDFRSVVFIRSDILNLLNSKTPDKGKDSIVHLQWQDQESLKQVIKERFKASGKNFESTWYKYFPESCRGIDSLTYMINHTLMRPRDLLSFCKLSIDTAIGRGHGKISEDDILSAEKTYSSAMLEGLKLEIIDIYGNIENCLLEFLYEKPHLPRHKVELILGKGLGQSDPEKIRLVLDVLIESGFLGLQTGQNEFGYYGISDVNLSILKKKSEKFGEKNGNEASYAIHPTFRVALEIDEGGTMM